ncbi:hypothetical protein N9V88_02365 [bacterium]|nr:hypothetical protein [bacterium]
MHFDINYQPPFQWVNAGWGCSQPTIDQRDGAYTDTLVSLEVNATK